MVGQICQAQPLKVGPKRNEIGACWDFVSLKVRGLGILGRKDPFPKMSFFFSVEMDIWMPTS